MGLRAGAPTPQVGSGGRRDPLPGITEDLFLTGHSLAVDGGKLAG